MILAQPHLTPGASCQLQSDAQLERKLHATAKRIRRAGARTVRRRAAPEAGPESPVGGGDAESPQPLIKTGALVGAVSGAESPSR